MVLFHYLKLILYTGTTPYSGGVLSEVLSGTGVTAQTFNQN